MNRIKKFYNDHKTEIQVAITTAAAVSTVVLYTIHKTKDGMQIKNARLLHDVKNNADFLCVVHKNGTSANYFWKFEEQNV